MENLCVCVMRSRTETVKVRDTPAIATTKKVPIRRQDIRGRYRYASFIT